jgi:outer membrane protein TolC
MIFSFDTTNLFLNPWKKKAAASDRQRAYLALIWEKWQVISQAHLAYIHTVMQNKILALLEKKRAFLIDYDEHIRTAVERGYSPIQEESREVTQLDEATFQVMQMQREVNRTHRHINEMLDLDPEQYVVLSDTIELPPLDIPLIRQEEISLLQHRPDLLALQASYQSEDDRYRISILQQFPAVSIGLAPGSQFTNLNDMGVLVSFDLPFFNKNHGKIAVEQATRQKIYDHFQHRFNVALNEINILLKDQELLESELKHAQSSLTASALIAHNVEIAYRKGAIDEKTYDGFQQDYIAKQIAVTKLQENLLTQRVALQTLLGWKLPVNLS